MVKRVLMISFQFPPMTGTSGIQRALRFTQYLPQFGWEPIVLTAHPCAYERTSSDQLQDIPESTHVARVFALDCARHLALRGRYLASLALPDRWSSWRFGAIPTGLALIRRFRPAAIWSTFPIPTAHRIALVLQRCSRLPWIADFRDVMTEDDYPAQPAVRDSWRALERDTLNRCARAVFTAPGAARMYAERYAQRPQSAFEVIENGYDEQAFTAADEMHVSRSTSVAPVKCMRILHSGVIYPSERDPTQLFAALARARAEGVIDANCFRLVLRATGQDAHIRALIENAGVRELVELAPPLPYREALAEMLSVDALLLLQAGNCSRQIPAKLYEYLRSRRPILGLASGDTAAALLAAGIDTIAPLESSQGILDLLRRFIPMVREGKAPIAQEHVVQRHSRLHKSRELARVLDAVA